MTDFGMRLTKCECGHTAVEHYDSHDFCTWTLDGECDCEKFTPVGIESWVTWSTGTPEALAPTPSDSPVAGGGTAKEPT